MATNIIYPTLERAVEVHESIINKSGGLHGIKDECQLESILTLMKEDQYYPKFIDKLTHLFYSMNKGHVFNDGNKRTSIAVSSFFLEVNGLGSTLPLFQDGMEEPAIWLACSLIDKDTIKKIIQFIIREDDDQIDYFSTQAKEYREPIEKGLIKGPLLNRMIDDWISNIELSSPTKLDVIDAWPEGPP